MAHRFLTNQNARSIQVRRELKQGVFETRTPNRSELWLHFFYIANYLYSIRDKNLGDTTVLSREMNSLVSYHYGCICDYELFLVGCSGNLKT